VVGILGLFLALNVQAQEHRLLPDPAFTPGAVRTTTASEICDKHFRTKPYRKTTKAMKQLVCAEYGVKDCPHQGKEELDHLIPLELGGLDVDTNLWVQFAPEFHWKAQLENKLKILVCAKENPLPLIEAQNQISSDWVTAYRKYIGPLPSDPQ
jgi:hypothetical protein